MSYLDEVRQALLAPLLLLRAPAANALSGLHLSQKAAYEKALQGLQSDDGR